MVRYRYIYIPSRLEDEILPQAVDHELALLFPHADAK